MSTDLKVIIGRNLTGLRKAAGLNTRQLSIKSGVSRSGLTLLESGKVRHLPSLTTLVKLADALGCELTGFLREPSCEECWDSPPDGFSCNVCGKGKSGIRKVRA